MQLVIDSSAIVERDWHLEDNAVQALLAACDRGEIELIVPQVVFDEIVNVHREREAGKVERLKYARAELRRLQGSRSRDEQGYEDPLSAQAGYASDLWRTLTGAGVRFLDFPDVDHQTVVGRALARRAPFDRSGQRGYRDVLIWHNVMEVASSGQVVVFVASDGDFRDPSNAGQLHPHLRNDLREAGLESTRIRLVSSLEEAVDEVLQPAQDVLETLRRRLAEDENWRAALFAQLKETAEKDADLVDNGVDVAVESAAEPFDGDIVEEEFDYVDDFRRVAIADALPLSGDSFGIELWMEATSFYRVAVSTSSFWSAPDRVPPGLDLSADESVAYFGGMADVILAFEARYDSHKQQLGEPVLKRMANDIDETFPHAQPRRRGLSRRAPQRRKRPRAMPWSEGGGNSPTAPA